MSTWRIMSVDDVAARASYIKRLDIIDDECVLIEDNLKKPFSPRKHDFLNSQLVASTQVALGGRNQVLRIAVVLLKII